MATYYVKNGGNNSASGLSDVNAWDTIAKVNGFTFAAGDTICFKCNCIWRETLTVPRSGSAGNWLTFKSYDAGLRPIILGSLSTAWSAEGHTNIWVCDATVVDPATTGYGSDIFFDASGVISQGLHKTYTSNFSNLTAEYHWTYNASKVYIYSPEDPDTRYTLVEIPQRTFGISIAEKEYIEIDEFEIKYFCSIGITTASYPTANKSYLTIQDCAISWSGLIVPNATNDKDNYGIHACYSNMLIKGCTIHDMGRRSISIYNYGSGFTVTNVIVDGCTLYKGYHTTGIDISCGSGGAGSSDFDGVIVRNNLVYDAADSYNYGSELLNIESYYTAGVNIHNLEVYNNILMNPQNSGVHLYGIVSALVYNNTFIGHCTTASGNTSHIKIQNGCTGVVIKNNISYSTLNKDSSNSNSRGNFIYVPNSTTQPLANITVDYNTYYRVLSGHGIIEAPDGTRYAYNNIAGIRSHYGWETNGQCIDPSFVSASDFHLAEGSPCIGVGVDVGLDTDFDGVAWAVPPSVGAYEYVLPGLSASISEAISLTDSPSAIMTAIASRVESLSFKDTPSAISTLLAGITESLSLKDTLEAIANLNSAISEVLELAESFDGDIDTHPAPLTAEISETFSLIDRQTVIGAMRWNGAAWVAVQAMRWTGTQWESVYFL